MQQAKKQADDFGDLEMLLFAESFIGASNTQATLQKMKNEMEYSFDYTTLASYYMARDDKEEAKKWLDQVFAMELDTDDYAEFVKLMVMMEYPPKVLKAQFIILEKLCAEIECYEDLYYAAAHSPIFDPLKFTALKNEVE